MGIVLDLSNYDYISFSPQCLKSNGVSRVIVNSWDYGISSNMLRRLREVGIYVDDAYAFLYFGKPWEKREVENAIRLHKEYGLKRIWLDVEARPPHEEAWVTPGYRIRVVRDCVNMIRLEGVEPGIYTGRWYWVQYMNNTREFSGLKLWHSEYGRNDGTLPPIRYVDYGGWHVVSVHQYTSQFYLCGRHRDANYWYIEEDDMTKEEFLNTLRNDKAFRDQVVAIVADELPVHIELDSRKKNTWQRVLGILSTGNDKMNAVIEKLKSIGRELSAL
jgi:hypothetical protein